MNANYNLTLYLFIGPLKKSWQHRALTDVESKKALKHNYKILTLNFFLSELLYEKKNNFGSFHIT